MVHWTTLQNFAARLPAEFWQSLLRATAGSTPMPAAIACSYRCYRVLALAPERAVFAIASMVPFPQSPVNAVCSWTRVLVGYLQRVCASHPHMKRARYSGCANERHDHPWRVVMDKVDNAYDSKSLPEQLDRAGSCGVPTPRVRCRTGRHRIQLRDTFPNREYAQKNIVESIFSKSSASYNSASYNSDTAATSVTKQPARRGQNSFFD